MTVTKFHAPDIECEGCANSICNALNRLPGVESVEVDIAAKDVTVEHEAPKEEVVAALDRAGFPAKEVAQ